MYGSIGAVITLIPSNPFVFDAATPATAIWKDDCLSKLTNEWSDSKYSANASAPLSSTFTGRAGYCSPLIKMLYSVK
jgi:hypothetical protein